MTLFSHSSGRGAHDGVKSVLIVDDSRVIRAWLRAVLSADPRLSIAGEASSAVEARDFLRAQPADVLTLDIEMPGMSGLEFLMRLMRARPMPVVMLSSLTSAGSDAAIQALSGGAIDCILKPTDGLDQGLSQDICDRVYNAACTKAAQLRPREPVNAPQPASPSYAATASARDSSCQRRSLVLIGASTGGVSALETVLPHLAPDGPPVVIVQHMPGNFLQSFSERLQRQLAQNVGLAEEGVVLRRGDVVLAPGNAQHTVVKRRADGWYCAFAPNEPASLHCPSVDSLFKSAVSDARYVTAAILTGLGRDGAEGLLELSQNGAVTFGQNEETSVVYGMPRAAHAAGAVQKQLPIDKIGSAIREGVRRPSKTDRQQLTHEAPTP